MNPQLPPAPHGGGGSSSSGDGGGAAPLRLPTVAELDAMAKKEWVMAKWRLVQQQRQELQAEWETACWQHNSAMGLPDTSACTVFT